MRFPPTLYQIDVTNLPPHKVGVVRYGLRMWVELGIRALKSVGRQWQRTRRTDPDRVARYWLVLAVATLWVLAYGTRVEDAQHRGRCPTRLHTPPRHVAQRPRMVCVFRLGWRGGATPWAAVGCGNASGSVPNPGRSCRPV
jgi:hypothetical protein